MEERKDTKNKFKVIEVYSVLILIATLFMSVGYAQITGTQMTIQGTIGSEAQDGVFIKDIQSITSDENTQMSNSTIDYYRGTTYKSSVVLGSNSGSYITYQISLYNNSNAEQVFIETLTDKTDTSQYSNTNIEFTVNGLEPYTTTIAPNGELNFTITFKYVNGANTTENTLKSLLNFRFQEKPTLVLSNENEVYTLDNIYPDYTPKEYEFTVSNYDTTKINTVPMTYEFEIINDKPLTAKIYAEDGTEVKGGITIAGDGTTKIEHKYTLKVIWDNSNPEENLEYNSLEYANSEFKCKVNLKATPDSDKYLDYEITKKFDVDIIADPFYFEVERTKDYVVLADNVGAYQIIVKNNNSSESNEYKTTYEISLEDNDKLSFSIDDVDAVENKISKTIDGGSIINDIITLNIKNISNTKLNPYETATLKVKTTSPYLKEFSFSISIRTRAIAELKGAFIEYNVAYKDAYTGYTYNTSNGWRIESFTKNQDGTLSDVKLISTGIPAKLYYLFNETQNGTWFETDVTKLEEFKNILKKDGEYVFGDFESSSYYALKAAAGMYNNFENIKFAYSTSDRAGNLGHFTQIVTNGTAYNSSNTSEVTGGTLFNLYGTKAYVRLLTLPEINKGLGRTDIDDTNNITSEEDTIGLYKLSELQNVNGMSSYVYSSGNYWVASPYPGESFNINVCYLENSERFDDECKKSEGVRPVICINYSNVEVVETNSETVFEIML